jgi:hypothetical protein
VSRPHACQRFSPPVASRRRDCGHRGWCNRRRPQACRLRWRLRGCAVSGELPRAPTRVRLEQGLEKGCHRAVASRASRSRSLKVLADKVFAASAKN